MGDTEEEDFRQRDLSDSLVIKIQKRAGLIALLSLFIQRHEPLFDHFACDSL